MKGNLPTIFRSLSSQKGTVVGLLVFGILTFWVTIYQANHGLYAAQQRFFGSWVLLIFNIIPFPGVKSVVVFLSANLIAAGIIRFKYSWNNSGQLVIHAGIVVLVCGMGFTHYFAHAYFLMLQEGESFSTVNSYRDSVCTGQRELPNSNGFTNNGAKILGLFVGAEILFLIAAMVYLRIMHHNKQLSGRV